MFQSAVSKVRWACVLARSKTIYFLFFGEVLKTFLLKYLLNDNLYLSLNHINN